jgi:hypothetical protein
MPWLNLKRLAVSHVGAPHTLSRLLLYKHPPVPPHLSFALLPGLTVSPPAPFRWFRRGGRRLRGLFSSILLNVEGVVTLITPPLTFCLC